jgi:Cu/Ag efflux pump CusA
VASDVEIERALNALNVTLNDQRLDRMDLGRLQQIVTLALGGEPHLRLVHDAEHVGRVAWMHDDADAIVGRIDLEHGPKWTVRRYGHPQSGGYTPSAG